MDRGVSKRGISARPASWDERNNQDETGYLGTIRTSCFLIGRLFGRKSPCEKMEGKEGEVIIKERASPSQKGPLLVSPG